MGSKEMNLKEENAVSENSSLFSKANSFTLPKQFNVVCYYQYQYSLYTILIFQYTIYTIIYKIILGSNVGTLNYLIELCIGTTVAFPIELTVEGTGI